jgi:hypothetical protein
VTFEPGRVVEVFSPDALPGRANFGSGYLAGGPLVLTAAHVVGARGDACRVRPFGMDAWETATVRWSGGNECDAALLVLEEPPPGPVRSVRLGRVMTRRRLSCLGLGFPLAQADAETGARDTEEVVGEIAPLSGAKSGLLTIHIAGSVPKDESGRSPWEGISGAGLFCGPILVGVVVVDPEHFGTDRLEAVPVSTIIGNPAFADVVREELGRGLTLEPVYGVPGGQLPSERAIANFLHQYLGDAARTVPFGGREAELAALDDWLEDPAESSYLLLVARPGRGKSALLARWWERLNERRVDGRVDVVFVPINIRYDLNRETTVLRALGSRLAVVHDEETAATTVDEWRDLVGTYLDRPSPTGRTTLVVLDGIDEAADWRVGPGHLPPTLAEDVRAVVSARLTAARPSADRWLAELGWSAETARVLPLDALSVEGTRDVIASAGPPVDALAHEVETVAQLDRLCEGDPLVLHLYLGHLAAEANGDLHAAVARLGVDKPGLDGFMARWWAEQERLWGTGIAAQGPTVSMIFNLLACARGPLERRELLTLARSQYPVDGDAFDAAIQRLERFVLRESPGSYVISHPRLAAYRVDMLKAGGELEGVLAAFAEWGLETLRSLREGTIEPASVAPYIVRHLGEHLDAVGAAPEQLSELLDPAWSAAWEEVADELNGHLPDVDRVRRAAASANAAAVKAGRLAPFLATEVGSAFVRAEALTTADLIGGELAGALVAHGIWSEQRALAACARVANVNNRLAQITALAPSLTVDGAHAAAALLAGIDGADDEFFGNALAAVAGCLASHGDIAGARTLVDGQEPGYARGAATLAVLPHLREEERASALGALHEDVPSADISARVELLEQLGRSVDAELARSIFGEPPTAFIADNLRGETGWWPPDAELDALDADDRAYALSVLAPWLPADDVQAQAAAALDSLVAEGHPHNVDHAVAALAPFLDARTRKRAAEVLETLLLGRPHWLALGRIALLSSVEEDERAGLRALILAELPVLFENASPSETADALAVLVQYGATDAVLDAIGDLDDSSWQKTDFLEAIAPHLDEPAVRRGLSLTPRTRREERGNVVGVLLARLASFGPDQAREALARVTTTTDEEELRAAAFVLRHTAEPQLATEGLWDIEDRALRLAAASSAARLIPLTGGVLSAVVGALGSRSDARDELQLEVFDELQRELPESELAADDTMAVAALLVHAGLHARKDEIIVRYLRRLAESAGARAVLEFAARLTEDTFEQPVMWAVVAVADALDDVAARSAAREAADAIQDPVFRVVAQAALLGLLPADEAQGAWTASIGSIGPGDTELRASSIALLLRAVPELFREETFARLVPNTLLDGRSTFASRDTWAGAMLDLTSALDVDQLRRLREASEDVGSSSSRSSLRAAIAGRLAVLGHIDEALDGLSAVNPEQAAAALRQAVDQVRKDDVARLVEAALELIRLPYYRSARARLWAVVSRRINDVEPRTMSDLMQRWQERISTRAELLVDLLAFAPALVKLGGAGAAAELLARLDPAGELVRD